MQEINYKQDFPLLESFYYVDENLNIVPFGFPPYDFKLRYWTSSKSDSYEASFSYSGNGIDGKNCRRTGDKLLVLFDGHKLNPGELKGEMIMNVPDELYPDGYRHDTIQIKCNAVLTQRPTPSPSLVDSKVIMPYIKGKDFTYDDFTPEQLEDIVEKVTENCMTKIEETVSDTTDKYLEKTLNPISDTDIEEMWKEME